MAKTATKPSPAKKRKTKKRAVSRVRRNGTSKAQAIREAAKKLGRKARPRDIIDALAKRGITVSSAQVSTTLKVTVLPNGRRGRNGEATIEANKAHGNGQVHKFIAEELIKLKKLAQQFQSSDRLKKTVATFERRLGNLFHFRKK